MELPLGASAVTRATRLRPPGTAGPDAARGLPGAPPGADAPPGLEAYRIRVPLQRLRRWIFLGLTAGTTGTGGWLMLGILGAGGVSPLELVILLLFLPTFGWISIPFWNAVIGFLLSFPRRNPLTLARERSPGERRPRIRSRTALVMPAHNEDPATVFGGLTATLLSLEETGQAERFDLYLLSDSTDPETIRAEERGWAELLAWARHPERLHYRRRETNAGRKPGNLADFCERWGDLYEFMIVLDADSVMSGASILDLVAIMEANPQAGLVQTVPLPARQETFFGRVLQFAAALHAPLQATGQSFWHGDASNYWGHNAILRLRPFIEHGRLPVLRGRPPLGGPLLSHDFVEAALLRRAGWAVYLAPWIRGSYEEVPGNVPDFAARDRRWTQGSLQHLRLLGGGGFHALSRLHFLLGAMGHAASLLWLLILLSATGYVVLAEAGRAAALTRPEPLLSAWAGSLAGPPLSLLAVTAVLLFLPKALALLIALLRERALYGGGARLVASWLLEMLFAVIFAPLMMLYHTRFIGSVVLGRDVPWDGRTRGGGEVAWRRAAREACWITGTGLAWAGVTLRASASFFLWLTPIFAGPLLALPLIRWTGSRRLGRLTREAGLLLVPSETGGDAPWARSPGGGGRPGGSVAGGGERPLPGHVSQRRGAAR